MILHLIVRYFLHYIKIYLDKQRLDTLSTDERIDKIANTYQIKLEAEIKELRDKQMSKITRLAELRSLLE